MTELGIDIQQLVTLAEEEASDLDEVLRLCGLDPTTSRTDGGRVRLDIVREHLLGMHHLLEQQSILLEAQTQRILELDQPTYFYEQVGVALGDWGPGDTAIEQAMEVEHPLHHGLPLYARIANN